MNVLVIHRSPVVAQGICLVLKTASINSHWIDWDGPLAFADILESFKPDVVLVDPHVKGLDTGSAVTTVNASNNRTPVGVILIDQTPGLLERAVASGANGFISLSMSKEDFINSLRLLAAGQVVATGADVTTLAHVAIADTEPYSAESVRLLSRREVQIAGLIADGGSNKKIASQLDLAEGTVKVHVRNIFRKLGISNRAELTSFAIRSGLSG
jgi:two-component system nitrate/nitrite response regulator NarL